MLLTVEQLAPQTPTFSLRSVDLDDAQLSLPAEFSGKPARYRGGESISVAHTDDESLEVIFLPSDDMDELLKATILDGYARATGIPALNWYQMVKDACLAEPFELWDVPAVGIADSIRRFRRPAFKRQLLLSVPRVRLLETDTLGLVVYYRQTGAEIEVCDLQTGAVRNVLVEDSGELAERVIAALAAYYRFKDSPPVASE